jgi:hypothetical protein
MSISNKIADSSRTRQRNALRCCAAFVLLLGLLAATSGCGTFLMYPIFPARTGAEGVVLDQYDTPIPNVELAASGIALSKSWILYPGLYRCRFHCDAQGRWKFYRRDARDLVIEAHPPSGFTRCQDSRLSESGRLYYGHYRTNVLLRLHKIEPPEQPKEAK